MEETLLTKEGLEKLQEELRQLKTVDRVNNSQVLKEARAQGDLSENADYDAAKDEQSKIENRIAEIENILTNATIISDDSRSKLVRLGSTVEVLKEGQKDVKTYTIVGTVEANPVENRISNECPLARAILEKPVSDNWLLVKSPNPYRVKIVSIKK